MSKRTKGDKIIDNDFNSGNIEFDTSTNKLEIDHFYSDKNLDECYNSEEYNEKKNTMILMVELFEGSKYYVHFKNKKFTKDVIPEIYDIFYDELDRELFLSNVQKFCYIAEFLNVSYEKVWDSIYIKRKEEVLLELDQTHGVFNKFNITKLF